MWNQLKTLVLPIAFQQFMLALVGASDAVMLGRLDQDFLSAASLAGQITFVYNLFLAAMTIGTSIFAAQYYGKKDLTAVEKILGIALRITVWISVIFFLASMLVPDGLMRIFTQEAKLIGAGVPYLRIVGFTYLMCSVSQIYLCIMKNTGKAVKSMVISTTTVLVNILLNAVLIFGLFFFPEMGIRGAAAATALARALELIWTIAESRRKGSIRIRYRFCLHPDRRLQKDFKKYTLPVLGNELVWGCGFTMYSVIMGHLGTDAVAANSVTNIVKNLVACFALGLGNGGGILVGNELGAGNLQKARDYGKRLCVMAVAAGFLSGILLLVLIPGVLWLMELTPQAAEYLRGMMTLCACYMVGKAVNSTLIGGIFCAGGDSRFGFLCDTVTMWCVTVPLGLLAAFVWKWPVPAVYFIVNMDELLKLPAVYRHYKKYKWVRDLTRKEEA